MFISISFILAYIFAELLQLNDDDDTKLYYNICTYNRNLNGPNVTSTASDMYLSTIS